MNELTRILLEKAGRNEEFYKQLVAQEKERLENPYDYSGASVEEAQGYKIEELKKKCTAAIYAGFTSSNGHSYGFNGHDQQNFDQLYLLVVAGDNAGASIPWKTLDAGVVDHTEAEFKTLVLEAKDHKLAQQGKYWQLENQVLAAATKEEVLAVEWA